LEAGGGGGGVWFCETSSGRIVGVWFEHVWKRGLHRIPKKFNFFIFC
jgi:hypothetical protein